MWVPHLVSEAFGSSRAKQELLLCSLLESETMGGGSIRVSAREVCMHLLATLLLVTSHPNLVLGIRNARHLMD